MEKRNAEKEQVLLYDACGLCRRETLGVGKKAANQRSRSQDQTRVLKGRVFGLGQLE